MSRREPIRVACVGYVNARPLIAGLEDEPGVRLSLHVPAKLLGTLERGEADVALLPVIDYQRLPGLRVLPVGGIGCDGHTLTVRLFSHVPFDRVATLACDEDSHTSVALARVLLERMYGVRPEFRPLGRASGAPDEARLLIGDKVICEEPVGFEHQLDLGDVWRRHTGLPFVFAVWCARDGVDLGDLPDVLTRAKQRGLADVRPIVERHAVPRGWPAGVALQYLTVHLKYDVGPRQLEAIRLFHRLAAEHGVIPAPPRPLDVV